MTLKQKHTVLRVYELLLLPGYKCFWFGAMGSIQLHTEVGTPI